MSCFSCCVQDDVRKASETRPHVTNHSAGTVWVYKYDVLILSALIIMTYSITFPVGISQINFYAICF